MHVHFYCTSSEKYSNLNIKFTLIYLIFMHVNENDFYCTQKHSKITTPDLGMDCKECGDCSFCLTVSSKKYEMCNKKNFEFIVFIIQSFLLLLFHHIMFF